jgi:excisionase family DNA binding protein
MLLTLSEAAAELGRSYNFVRRLVDEGEIPVRVVHGRRYVHAPTLTEWARGDQVTAVKQRTYSWK